MHGQPPSITAMPCARPYSAASGETLPAPGLLDLLHPGHLRRPAIGAARVGSGLIVGGVKPSAIGTHPRSRE